jgi:hypothetical protein
MDHNEETINSSSTHQQSIELPLRRDYNRDVDDSVLHGTISKRPAPLTNPDLGNTLSSQPSQNLTNKPVTDPIRTDPQNVLEPKKRKLDRQVEDRIPEIHIVGNVVSANDIIYDATEGGMCR